MSDRELLEAAARAAGVELIVIDGALYFKDMGLGNEFNPLVDDAQAFRLAVKLGMHCVDAFPVPSMALIKECDGDEYAATRRAIVRAAAQLGEEQ